MPIYLRRETKERPMHDQDPSDSPRLAAADLTEVAGMMRGLSALAAKRGRPLPLNDTSYTSEDLEAIASRLQQIADYFNDVRKLIRTGQTKEQATPKAKAKPKAKPPSTKALIGALNEADREFADGLTPSDQGQAGMVLRSRCTEEAWPMVVRGDVSLDLAARVCQTEENAGTSLTFEQLLWCWKAETKAGRAARRNGLQLGNRAEEFVRMVEEGVDEEAACEALNV